MNIFLRVFDQMARMGLAFKSDAVKVIETEGREFGTVAGGFDLSVGPRQDQKDLVSVILRNVEPIEKKIITRGWLHFLHVHITMPAGGDAPLSLYGREALNPARAKPATTLRFSANEMVETELPIGILYDMTEPGTYRLVISCELPDSVLTSNECTLKHG